MNKQTRYCSTDERGHQYFKKFDIIYIGNLLLTSKSILCKSRMLPKFFSPFSHMLKWWIVNCEKKKKKMARSY